MKIKIVDDLDPENVAMVQGLYSRSAASVDDHLAKVQASGSAKFWDNYVVGYNHKSIADCGSTTIFIEGVSILAAKAIQDSPLYSGQETSTRYIDMSKQVIVDPVIMSSLDERGAAVLSRWMRFYEQHQGVVMLHVAKTHPMKEGEDPEVYNRAVKARTFDILRGFLPAGITTQLSWHTNLRQAGDHLTHLSHHPSPEIREIAKRVRAALVEKYPSSGFEEELASVSGVANKGKTPEEIAKAKAEAEARAAWEKVCGKSFAYGHFGDPEIGYNSGFDSTFKKEKLQSGVWELLQQRPRGCVMPHFVSAAGTLSWAFTLDFGSFRDLQRHRNGVCRMPLLGTENGFEPWYLEQLPPEARSVAELLVFDQTKAIAELSKNPVVRQYYTALGFRVGCEIAYALPAVTYIVEMRSSKTVHPTLRKVVLEYMIPCMRRLLPDLPLHVDESPDYWTVHRGRQTITEKSSPNEKSPPEAKA